jgi:hypothetical protein
MVMDEPSLVKKAYYVYFTWRRCSRHRTCPDFPVSLLTKMLCSAACSSPCGFGLMSCSLLPILSWSRTGHQIGAANHVPAVLGYTPFVAEMALAEYGFLEDILRGYEGHIEPPFKCSKYSLTL